MYKKNNKKGFTLVELLLVLSVSLGISFSAFKSLLVDQENISAKAAGQQIRQVGESVNSYIAVHYDKLSVLANADGTATDPGPRTCSTGTNTCVISIQTLVNEGLLPPTYGSTNVFRSGYSIILRRSGSAPYYNVTGLVSTLNSWTTDPNKIRYDLLGKAMQNAGVDSGMSKDSATIINGYGGNWVHTSAEYSSINKLGLLAYQVGYGTYSYSIYLRRDGTLPMTGNLNMGAQSINNAKDINASGTGTFGGEVVAHNGNGDAITLGGDAAGGAGADYELRLGSNKTLTIFSPNSTQYSTVLNVNRNAVINERLSSMGYNPNDLPSGWGGGLRTLDVYAAGTVATGSGGNLTSYMNASGVHTTSDITAQGSISASGNVSANNNVSGNGIYGNYIQSNGSMYSAGQISTASNISASGNISGNGLYGNYVQSNGSMYSAGRLTTNEFVQINGVAGEGAGCSPNGLVGRTAAGKILSCTNGVWTAAAIGVPGYYCRLTSFDKGRSDDYVGYVPRTDQNCPVIAPGSPPQGFCSCIKVILNY